MKSYLFLYREDRTAHSDTDYGYINQLACQEHKFPANTTDQEILLEARKQEAKDQLQEFNTASEGVLNRQLLRVIQIARDLPLDLLAER